MVRTSDNPRSEEPTATVKSLRGLKQSGASSKLSRSGAPLLALRGCASGRHRCSWVRGTSGTVLATGAVPFNDAEVGREALAELGFRHGRRNKSKPGTVPLDAGVLCCARTPSAGPVTGYSIDSRTLAPEFFFAIHAEHFDGHNFVQGTFSASRAAVIASSRVEEFREIGHSHIAPHVGDPLTALQMLAAQVRRHWGGRVVGVTGSAGKTTTKDAIAQVSSRRFNVLKSQGNLNNGFGLPLQSLRLQPEHWDCGDLKWGHVQSGRNCRAGEDRSTGLRGDQRGQCAHAKNFCAWDRGNCAR